MTVYYFNVRDGAAGIADPEGTELPNHAAAEAHAAAVVRELLKGHSGRKALWCLQVGDRQGRILFTLPFSAVDPNLDHLQGETRGLIEQVRESRRRLEETMFRSGQLQAQSQAMQRRKKAGPYLIAESGRRIA